MTKDQLVGCPPADSELTDYDRAHLKLYLRLLDADAEGADWAEVAEIVLHLDPRHDTESAKRIYAAHLARAKWMADHGFFTLLRANLH